jgi:hypothetical protein
MHHWHCGSRGDDWWYRSNGEKKIIMMAVFSFTNISRVPFD